LKTGL